MPRQQQAPATTQPTRIITRKNSVRTHFVEWAHITSYSLRIFNIVHHRLYAYNSLSPKEAKETARVRESEWEKKQAKNTHALYNTHYTQHFLRLFAYAVLCVCLPLFYAACLIPFKSGLFQKMIWEERSRAHRLYSIYTMCWIYAKEKVAFFFVTFVTSSRLPKYIAEKYYR